MKKLKEGKHYIVLFDTIEYLFKLDTDRIINIQYHTCTDEITNVKIYYERKYKYLFRQLLKKFEFN